MKRRQTNPLCPDYKLPGYKETPLHLEIDPYGYSGCSMTKDLYVREVQRPQTAQNYTSGNIKDELQKQLKE